ncbi:FAP-74 protein [Pseudoscourfieldia marina]
MATPGADPAPSRDPASALSAMEELEALWPDDEEGSKDAVAGLSASNGNGGASSTTNLGTAALHARRLKATATWDENKAVLKQLQDDAESGAGFVDHLRADLAALDEEMNHLAVSQPQPGTRIERLQGKRASAHASLRAQLAKLEENRHAQVNAEQALRMSELALTTANDEEKLNYDRREGEIEARKARHAVVRKGELQRARDLKAMRKTIKAERDAKLDDMDAKELAQIMAAQDAHDVAVRRLRSTHREVEREFSELQTEAENLRDHRLDAVSSLKQNVDAARSELATSLAQHTRERTHRLQEQAKEAKVILAQGGNPYETFRRRELEAKAARQHKAHQREMQARELGVVKQSLLEENMRRKELMKAEELAAYNETFQDEMGTRAVEQRNEAFMMRHTTGGRTLLDPTGRKPVPPSEATNGLTKSWAFGLGLGTTKEVLTMVRTRHPKVKPAPLLLPSYPGFEEEDAAEDAARDPGVGDVASEELSASEHRRIELRSLSVLEQKSMAKARERHKQTLTKKQVCLGRTFQGAAFIANPTKVVFQDFDVGVVHTQKVTLTNVSFTFNQFKLLDFPDNAEGAFTVKFENRPGSLDRPGRMSAGTTCDMHISFEPHEEKDIETHIPLLSETGPINIPLVAYKKRFSPALTISRPGDLRKVALTSVCTADEPGSLSFGEVEIAECAKIGLQIDNEGAVVANLSLFVLPAGSGVLKDEDDNDDDSQGPRVDASLGPVSIKASKQVVAGYSRSHCELSFAPTDEKKFACRVLLRFKDMSGSVVRDMYINVTGRGGKVPVVTERDVVDLQYCCIGHTYRDSLVIHNRSKSARKCTIQKRPELDGVFEFYPDLAFCQSNDSYAFQIKFTPTERTRRQCARYLSDDGVLEIPMRVTTEQAAPVNFTLRCVLTNAGLVFDPPNLNFGECPTTERIVAPLRMMNTSSLPQDFGFTNLPKGMLVTPDDGFGTILPGETMSLDVSFEADFPMNFDIPLTVRSHLNHTYRVPCTAQGILPPMTLSDNVMYLPATAFGDSNNASVILKNNSNMAREFEFAVDKACGLKVSPKVGYVAAGGSLRVQVDYYPSLHDDAVLSRQAEKEEAVDGDAEKEEGAADEAQEEEKADDSKEGKEEEEEEQQAPGEKVPALTLSSTLDETMPTDPWCFPVRTQLPCFMREVRAMNEDVTVATKASAVSIVYLEVCSCAIEEELYVEPGAGMSLSAESGKPYNELNFGSIPIRERKILSVVVVNASRETVSLRQEGPLDPGGAFSVLNPYQSILPGESHRVLLEFAPTGVWKFFEMLSIRTDRAKVRVALTGDGISPSVDVEPAELLESGLDFGSRRAGESTEKTFQVSNSSTFELRYDVRVTGTMRRNIGGHLPFYCVPASGVIAPEEKQDVKVIFAPDACAPLLEAQISVEVPNQTKGLVIRCSGRCWEKDAYLCGTDPGNELRTDEEEDPIMSSDEASVTGREETLQLTLQGPVCPGQSAEREVSVGCVSGGGGVDYTASELMEAESMAGWRVEHGSGSVSAGEEKKILFKFECPTEPVVGSMMYFGLGGWSEARVAVTLAEKQGTTRRVVIIAKIYTQPSSGAEEEGGGGGEEPAADAK